MNSVSAVVHVPHADGAPDFTALGNSLGQGEWQRSDGNRQQRGGDGLGVVLHRPEIQEPPTVAVNHRLGRRKQRNLALLAGPTDEATA